MEKSALTRARSDESLERLATLLDSAFPIPGTGIRFGLDALIGLVPVIGDLLPGMLSLLIVFEGSRRGMSNGVLVRMIGNILIDTLIGSIPLLGDVFDVSWKANVRNMKLFREANQVSVEKSPLSAARRLVYLAALVLMLIMMGLGAFLVLLLRRVF